MEAEINDLNVLKNFLGRAYWIEGTFENSAEWEVFTEAGSQFGDIIFQLASDSQIHKSLLEEIASNLGIDIKEISNESKPKEFNFEGKRVEDMFSELSKYEELMKELYTRLYNNTGKQLIIENWKGEDPQKYFYKLKWLISEEERHIEIIKPHKADYVRII